MVRWVSHLFSKNLKDGISFIFFVKMGTILIKVRLVRKVRLTIIDILSTKGGLVMLVRKVRMVRLTIKYRFSQKGTPSNVGKICKKGKIYFIPNSYFPEKRTHNQ